MLLNIFPSSQDSNFETHCADSYNKLPQNIYSQKFKDDVLKAQ